MNFNIENIFTWANFSILLDVLIIWYLVYRLILLIKGTKAVQLAKGIVFIFAARILASLLSLNAVGYLVDQLVSWSVIACIVIFQPEIRRGLERLGRLPWFNGKEESARDEQLRFIKEIDKAVQYMSKRRIGALITIQQDTGLDEYVETGIKLDAEVTGDLLINIFIPNTPLHDGAVIISGGRVAVAAAYLPLSDNNMIPKRLGTRHRAAVGISEVTDAITVVVSEETGGVTITRNGNFMVDMTRDEYLKYLTQELVPKDEPKVAWYHRLLGKFWKWGADK
ncbi:diadenylate cyclase CdaA [Lactobacillus corticis]|uniref:Diadenylate cyclase n=1 Tax=Lactobacillus corticis TaxID=2201249 RepID=A0A916VJ61_9LACO|nr:diadenylate cyclase CdaA [Lactobacillus corticis]GFZ27149.1 membrane protein [Lactobacillus corticis]